MATTHLNKSVIAGGNIKTIKALKKYWNSPVSDIEDNSNQAKYTMLQMAILLNKKNLVEYLIPQKDLDLTTRATDGTTALMTAVGKNVPVDWIRAMLERGAADNINVEDNEGKTALDRCEKDSEVYKLLVQYGAQPRPSPPPTPPPEPEADHSHGANSTDKNAATENGTSKPEDAMAALGGTPPGWEEHPGMWATMCGCGGRPGKNGSEIVEIVDNDQPVPKHA
ncbi:putative ankyrin repeat-containing protein [Neospora caninum Liverpool]|uniref:Ankyrin repeat-containing protein, putative n=1 Tax=Neospora caninum (strain Liverpool) TaxID=572307 RepID=F0VGE5_NEOCL|nr:putative ankyrin repeat-containing protein [Neospora caninum Liverpool]CBZ52789.1 putative ankyrin repeat-containing protein [Neospora caninum Liverpool]CEL66771.1 TPA: ankyrin repeat-containing protein, putative [Neospora caninum Liverpool]|eukprot:XP_003882821.1 putative ankyrin repeat-containing protein [Neospora caninum Liverpool]